MGRFSAAPSRGPCFSLGYACILPSSLTRALPPPSHSQLAHLCRSMVRSAAQLLAVVSRRREPPRFPPPWGRSFSAPLGRSFVPGLDASRLPRAIPAARRGGPSVSPLRKRGRRGNVDPLPVGYGLHPRLRGRLTLGQIAFTLETSGFRRRGIPPLFHVTHACILSPAGSTEAPASASPPRGMLSYRPWQPMVPRLRLRA